MSKKVKVMKIKGKVEVPVEVNEDKFTDMFLEWVEDMKFLFAGSVSDESK